MTISKKKRIYFIGVSTRNKVIEEKNMDMITTKDNSNTLEIFLKVGNFD